MKAAVWYGKEDVRVEERPEPKAGPGMVKVEVAWCGICGTDLHEYAVGPIFIPYDEPHPLTGKKAPMILGHEFCGTVVEVGRGVNRIKVGERVTADGLITCGQCWYCRRSMHNLCLNIAFTGLSQDGGFARYVVVPEYACHKLRAEIPDTIGALIDPLATGLRAMRVGEVKVGDSVAIVGAGPIGLSTLLAARACGARQIFVVELANERKKIARQIGATAVLDPREDEVLELVYDATDGLGADVAVECVGGPETTQLSLDLVHKGGRVVLAGIAEEFGSIDFNAMVLTEKEIKGCCAYCDEFEMVIDLLADKRINPEPLISRKIKIDQIVEEGFLKLITKKDENIKILVAPR